MGPKEAVHHSPGPRLILRPLSKHTACACLFFLGGYPNFFLGGGVVLKGRQEWVAQPEKNTEAPAASSSRLST